MPDEQRFDRPLVVVRTGKVVEDNVKEFLEWRKRTDPDAYSAAMRQLVEVIAEATVRQLLAEKAEKKHDHSPLFGDSPEREDGAKRQPKIVPLTDIDEIRTCLHHPQRGIDSCRDA